MNRLLAVLVTLLLAGCPQPGGTDGGSGGGTAGSGGVGGGSAGGSAGGAAGGSAGGSAGGTAGGSAGGTAGGSAGGTAGGSAGGTAGGAGGGFTSDGGSIPLDVLCGTMGNAYCTHLTGCGLFGGFPTCLTYFSSQQQLSGGSCAGENGDAVDAGRQAYDGFAANRCLSAIANLPCTIGFAALEEQPDCLATFRGLSGASMPCQVSADCQPALYCSRVPGTCGGSCANRIAVGLAAGSGECERGAYQDSDGVCRRPVAAGASCAQVDGGVSDLQRCTAGNYCDRRTQLCTAVKAPGVGCSGASDECGPYLYCLGSVIDGGATCRAPASVGEECNTRFCKFDSWCRPDVDAGFFCRAWSPLGGECVSDQSCAPISQCTGRDAGSFSFGTCSAPGGAGAPCDGEPADCASGFFCPSGVGGATQCAPRVDAGQPCMGDVECLSNICRSPADGGPSQCRSDYRCF